MLAMLKVPPGSKRTVNAPNLSGSAGIVAFDCWAIKVDALTEIASNVQQAA